MKESVIRVTIHKWEKHNGEKKDGHRRIQVDARLRSHPKILSATKNARLLYMWLLMQAGDDMRKTVEFFPSQASMWCGFGRNMYRDCMMCVESLEENQLVTIENRDSSYIKEKKEKKIKEVPAKKTEAPAAPEFDFEILYDQYPRKVGKDLGMKRLLERITNHEDYAAFERAVKKYASECRLQRADVKYIKHWSTFVGTDGNEPWRDFSEISRPKWTAPAPEPINEPPFDPIDVDAIRNPHVRKLLNIVQGSSSTGSSA